MHKLEYKFKTKSSLILSPRTSQLFYRKTDNDDKEYGLFKMEDVPKDVKEEYLEKEKLRMIYPFYQYGEYDTYHPSDTEYYIPGSSIKGALLGENKKNIKIMVDDILVKSENIVVRNLYKAQYINHESQKTNEENKEEKKSKFHTFFENVGIEMIKSGVECTGEIYFNQREEIDEAINLSKETATCKMSKMMKYIKKILDNNTDREFIEYLIDVKRNIKNISHNENIIFLGGYKGLYHSLIINENIKKCKNESEKSAIYIDRETRLPHGLIEFSI